MSKQKLSSFKFVVINWLIIVGVCLFYIFLYSTSTAQSNSNYKPVINCIDGDTFSINSNYYRLSYIDTPERSEPLYKEASKYSCYFLKNRNVKLKEHGLDKYNRTLVEVIDINGFSLNRLLVDGCLATPFYGKSTKEIVNLYNINCK
jgi:endonuclease YncB( thermonuclease family)